MSENENKVMALMALAANFGKEFPECLLPVWLDLLEPYPASLVNAGVRRVILDYEYKTLPPFAVLRRALDAASGQPGPEEGLALAAEGEWIALLEAVKRRGRYGGEPELHPTTAQVLRAMGGWENACDWEEKRLEWRRREFLELWKQLHGHEDLLALGACAKSLNGPTHAGALLARMLPERMEEA